MINLTSETFSKKYDYIFTGAGCAALSLLMRMVRSGKFSDKQVLLLDKAPKVSNDRTWCFWEREKGFFEDLVCQKWNSLRFDSNSFSSSLDIAPYRYKMIRSIDFYDFCFRELQKHGNIQVAYGEVRFDNGAVFIDDNLLPAGDAIIFNSIYRQHEIPGAAIYLRQHFKGWIIETPAPAFNVQQATLMDFRVHQDYGTSFSYLLPLTETKALIEYTLFTEKLLEPQQYDAELRKYIRDILEISDYTICEEEFGVIPMTNITFPFYENGVYNIGTAGGQTKPSTGYTFRFIQQHSERILGQLLAGKSLSDLKTAAGRFHFYDTVLLRLLKENKLKGAAIFSRLFQRNKASQVFKFLDNDTSITEELRIISTLPTLPFLQAAIR